MYSIWINPLSASVATMRATLTLTGLMLNMNFRSSTAMGEIGRNTVSLFKN